MDAGLRTMQPPWLVIQSGRIMPKPRPSACKPSDRKQANNDSSVRG